MDKLPFNMGRKTFEPLLLPSRKAAYRVKNTVAQNAYPGWVKASKAKDVLPPTAADNRRPGKRSLSKK